MVSAAQVRGTRGWSAPAPGPTATVDQRARRRRARGTERRALVVSRRRPPEALAAAVAAEGLQLEWLDSGPGAVGEVVSGDVAVCIVDAGRRGGDGLDYLPCLNQADPLLPVVVVNDADSLDTQRRIRAHKVFYYLLEPFDPGELREVLRAATGSPGRA